MDTIHQHEDRYPVLTGTTFTYDHHRCIPKWMGSTSTGSYCTGQMVNKQNVTTYKLAETPHSMQFMLTFPPAHKEQSDKLHDGQYHMHVLCELAASNSIPSPMQRNNEILELVHPSQHQCISRILTRMPEHNGGYPQQTILLKRQMGTEQHDLQYIFQQWDQPTIDLFVTTQNHKCPHFCSRPGLGSRSMWGRLPPHMEHRSPLCVPNHNNDIQSHPQNMLRQDKGNIDDAHMAQENLVFLPTPDVSMHTNHSYTAQ